MRKSIAIFIAAVIAFGVYPACGFAEETEKVRYRFTEIPTYTDGAWTFLTAPLTRVTVSEEQLFPMPAASDGQWRYSLNGSWATCGAEQIKNGFVSVRPNLELNGYRFTAFHDGNYKYMLEARNVGEKATARYGGDGVIARWQVLAPDDEIDITYVSKLQIPPSSANPETVYGEGTVALKAGESLTLWLDTGANPTWDVLELQFTLEETDEEGVEWVNLEYEPLLPEIPKRQLIKPAPFRDGLFWINRLTDGKSEQRQEAYDLWRKYMPRRFGIISENSNSLNGVLEKSAEFFAKNNISTLHHGMGNKNTHRYFEAYDALETNWTGKTESRLSPYHDSSKSHEKFTHVFDTITKAQIGMGFGGSGVVDYIWDWSQGRGRTGFSPATIEQYKINLKDEDEGLRITVNGGDVQTLHFWDYAAYYLGRKYEPYELGFLNWDEYTPLTQSEYLKETSENYSNRDVLHDLLTHYELTRVLQSLSVTANQLGGVYQGLINPEDMANGTDSLFLGGLDDLRLLTDEFFNDAHLIDGAYYHYSYLHDFEGDSKRIGGVMEGGGGGQRESYWDKEVCYAMAYEVSTAAELTHMEGDYWPGLYDLERMNDYLSQDLVWQTRRGQDMLSYARGYADAADDKLEKLSPDFLSITSRRILRPWGLEYNPVWGTGNWAYHTRWYYNPEHVLAKKGFVFRGIGEDGVERYLDEPRKVISYSPDRPVRYHFDKILEKVESGSVENMITPAGSLREIMDTDLLMKKMSEVYPEFSGTAKNITVSGSLTGPDGNIIEEQVADAEMELYEMQDNRYTPVFTVGGTPVVVETQYGGGKIYIVLFDPWRPETYKLTGAVYTYLLGQSGVSRHWETIEATGEMPVGITLRDNLSKDLEMMESEASVRMYYNTDGMIVAGIQSPWVRSISDADISINDTLKDSPYRFKGTTRVKVLVEPNTEYEYAAMPSGMRGRGTSGADGMLEIAFGDTTHEIFYILPSSPESVMKLSKIIKRRHIYYDAVSFDGRLDLPDVVSPVTVPSINGNTLILTAEDNQKGDGIKKLEYSINGKQTVTVSSRSVINKATITHSVPLSRGGNIVCFKASDNAGNVESEGTIKVFVK
jgi:hypothetical protein